MSFSSKLMLSDWNWKTPITEVRLQEELVMKEKALRDTQIRSIHEMEEMKRAQELRVDEFSVHY